MSTGAPINAMQETHTGSMTDASNESQNLSEERIRIVMNGIREVFKLKEEEVEEDEALEDDDTEPVVDLVDQERRKTKLEALLPTLAQLWWSDSEHMDVATELLADGSRDCK